MVLNTELSISEISQIEAMTMHWFTKDYHRYVCGVCLCLCKDIYLSLPQISMDLGALMMDDVIVSDLRWVRFKSTSHPNVALLTLRKKEEGKTQNKQKNYYSETS